MSTFERDIEATMSVERVNNFHIHIRSSQNNLRTLANEVTKILGGRIDEINTEKGEATISIDNVSQAEATTKIVKNINYCVYIRPSTNGLEIEEFQCPPCKEGAVTKLPEKYFLLAKDRIVEKRGKDTYLVYVCRFTK